jgi:ABC-type phosphate/phosphonate transport system substrate-binding protein
MAKLRRSDVALAFVPYPFYVEHAAQLHFAPLAQADMLGIGPQEKWTLVAKSGQVTSAASMGGYTILSVAGYAPDFVRHTALAAWALPPDVKVDSTGQILSALRKVASGDKVAALLDQTETAALATLPFASDLKSVTQSAPLPVALIAVVESRLPTDRAQAFQAGLLKMSHQSQDAEALGALRLKGFVVPHLPGGTVAP